MVVAARALATYLLPGCVGRGVRLGSEGSSVGGSGGGGVGGGVWKSRISVKLAILPYNEFNNIQIHNTNRQHIEAFHVCGVSCSLVSVCLSICVCVVSFFLLSCGISTSSSISPSSHSPELLTYIARNISGIRQNPI